MLLPRFLAGALSVSLIVVSVASGQDYPSKPVRIITGSIGGGNDTVSRLIAPALSTSLGQPVVVENRVPIIASETVAKAPPDGYSILVHGSGMWILPLLQSANYDPLRDFSPITQVSKDSFILAVHSSLPVKSVKELIALAKSRPGDLNYSATGNGGITQLSTELFKSMAGVNIVPIPYNGTGLGLNGLLSGATQMIILDIGLIMPQAKVGKVRALAITSAEPSPLAPGLPTVAASGLPDYESTGRTIIFAPAKTPATIVNRLNQEIVRFLNRPEVKERFLNNGSEIVANSPEQFGASMKADIAKWDKVIKDAGIKSN